MEKHQEERKTPVIMVKKRRTFSPPSLSEQTDIIVPVSTEQATESTPAGIISSAVETHIPEAPARKKKKKRHRFPRPAHWTREYTHECVEKIKTLFPHLRAEGGGFIPLKIGISNDISAFLAEMPGYRTVHGRMVLCSVLHHLPPRISAADLCRRRPSLWAGWSSRWAGLRN